LFRVVPAAAHNVAAAVLWRKPQTQARGRSAETKSAAGNFQVMILAVTGQWVAEVTFVLCLFGAACIGLAITAGEGGDRAAPRAAEQNASERNSAAARRETRTPDDG
jgi:hypothetical protein